jgi:PAS domain S-box-containing protein
MDDHSKAPNELLEELRALRQRIALLEEATQSSPMVDQDPLIAAQLAAHVFQKGPVAIGITRLRDDRFVKINDQFLQFTGYSADEVMGHTSRELRLWVDLQERWRLGQTLLAEGQVRDAAIRFRIKDGTIRSGRVSLNVIELDGERYMLTMAEDISQRIIAEEALRASEQRFRLLFEQSPDAILLLDPFAADGQWPIVDCNAAACRMTGFTMNELVGRSIDQVRAVPTTAQQDSDYLAELRHNWTLTFELQNRRKDGTTYDVECSVSLVVSAGRELVLEIERDITERKAVEESLHYLVDATTQLVTSIDYQTTLTQVAQLTVPRLADWCAVDLIMPDGSYRRMAVAHTDPDKVALAWELEQHFGFDPDLPEGAAKVLRTGQPEFYPEITSEMLRLISHNDEHHRLLQQVGLKSGMIVPLIAHGRTLGAISLGMAESGRRFRVVDVQFAHDLANRAAMAVDNARLYQEAQQAIRTRDEFLSIAAHELRTPLTVLYGYTQLLQDHLRREQPKLERMRSMAQVTVDQSLRLTHLLNSLLDLSRIDTGHFALDCAPLDIVVLLERVATELRLITDEHEIILEMPAAGSQMVYGDEQRLHQVFQNLIGNAIKYSPPGPPVNVSLRAEPDVVEVSISDQGIGIAPDDLPHLFDRYYRAPNTRPLTTGGLGIGLYLVHTIVSGHGGTIDVRSEPWHGSTFTVRLPRLAESAE